MKAALPLVIAGVLAGVVYVATMAEPAEACGRAIVTFLVVLFIGLLVTRRKRDDTDA